jgi:hypothetical protein
LTDTQRARIIWTIVMALSTMGLIGLSALCLTLFYKNYADPAVLTAIIAISSGVIGSLGTMAVAKPSPQPAPDITVSSPPPTVEVKQPANEYHIP